MSIQFTPRQIHDARDAVGAIQMAASAIGAYPGVHDGTRKMLEIITRRAAELLQLLNAADEAKK